MGFWRPSPPTPREKRPNILGFYVAYPPGENGGVVVIGAAVEARHQPSLVTIDEDCAS
jgi:hypothetical protein